MDNGASSYRRFLAGDKEGLAEVIREYADGVLLYVNSIVHNISLAEDITEETFVRLYAKKPKFSGKSTFKTWLYSIAGHTAVDCIRHSSRLPQVSADDVKELSDYHDLEKSYIRSEERILLHRSIQKLNPEYSRILYLVYFEDFSSTEAAQIMNKSSRQIRSLLYNAKKALRTELERSGYKYEEP